MVVEDPNFRRMQGFPHAFTFRDEIYQPKDYSRDKVHVIIHMDASKLDLNNPRVSDERRADKDFAVAWARMYGKGRVYYNTIGHRVESWALGLTNADVTPRGK